MDDQRRPTMRSRKLGQRLRAIREERGLTLQKAARLLNRTPSSLSKLETGKRGIRRPALEHMLDRYGVTDTREREYLFELAQNAAERGWWHRYEGDLQPSTLDYIALEAEATMVRSFQLHLVPGLLQTEDYTRAVIRSQISMGESLDIEKLAAIRLRRQRVLAKPRPALLNVVISEAVLRQQVGGVSTMDAQLRRLSDAAQLSNVEIRVLPYSAGAQPGHNGSYHILTTRDLSVVLIENLTTGWYLEEDEDVRRHALAFDHLVTASLSPSDSLDLIERLRSGA
ncbi:helix-turn-helix domain-containing protein [Actinomadura syzygii]|uniref:Helix-turn-helix domain-containing protein n=1 Tax=Actinomadura syzygii TaxID=1427538 RepID=A0A5D0TYE6_9ACTN|nr:helix-turn-helix transcriptional regulator [Actinomadura syzygii]TYC11158.1 helix-turn-helix domain-containing protein [Actinomadura syzygii]